MWGISRLKEAEETIWIDSEFNPFVMKDDNSTGGQTWMRSEDFDDSIHFLIISIS